MSLFNYEREGDADGLIEALEGSENAEVRRRAAEFLGGFDEPDDRERVVDALIETVREDERAVATAAIDALDQLGNEAVETLLARMADREIDVDAPDGAKAEAFEDLLDADAPELRMAAAAALGHLGLPAAVPALIDRLDDPAPRVRARAARACGAIADGRATNPLAARLDDPTTEVRREAAEALGRIGSRGALEALLDRYDDENEAVRRIAVAGLGSFESDRPVAALSAALEDPAQPVRRMAVYSLIEVLAAVPPDEGHAVRETVVDELAATGDPTVVEPLTEVLSTSTRPAQRRNAAWLLGRVVDDDGDRDGVDRDVVDGLLAAVADEDDQLTRQFAATSLAEIGGDYARWELLALAEDEGAATGARDQAIFALGAVGDDDAAKRLATLSETAEDDAVAEAAERALERLGSG